MNKQQIKQIRKWVEDILLVEYNQPRESKLRLEDIKEMMKSESKSKASKEKT